MRWRQVANDAEALSDICSAKNANKHAKQRTKISQGELFKVVNGVNSGITRGHCRAMWEELQGKRSEKWRPDYVAICAMAASTEVEKKMMRLFSLMDLEGATCTVGAFRNTLA